MAKDIDLNSLEQSLKKTIEGYSDIAVDNNADITKAQALQILSKELKMVSDEKTRSFNEDLQSRRYELEKDKVYESQKIERDKLNDERENNKKNYDLALKRIEIDLKKIDIENRKLNFEEKQYIEDNLAKRKEKILAITLDIIKVIIPTAGSIIAAWIYVKFMKQCMSITMVDNGIVSKQVQDIIKQFDKFAKIKN